MTFVDLGGGVEGATTTALNADVVGFSRARGLYAGISLGGSMLSAKSNWNAAYYGRPVGVQQIIITMEVSNPAADPLRAILSRYGAQATLAAGGPVPLEQGPIGAPPPPVYPVQRQPLAPVQQQSLGGPRRY